MKTVLYSVHYPSSHTISIVFKFNIIFQGSLKDKEFSPFLISILLSPPTRLLSFCCLLVFWEDSHELYV